MLALPRVLAVHMGEHCRQITCAGDCLGRHRLRDAREVGRRQRHVERAERFLELIAARERIQAKASCAVEVRFTPADLARIAQAVPAEAVAGTRYLPAVLAHMDSEHAG